MSNPIVVDDDENLLDLAPPAPPAPSAPSPPSEPPKHLSNEDILTKWLNEKYFECKYECLTISISVYNFLQLLCTASEGFERSWLIDDQIDLPLILLMMKKKRDADFLIIPTQAGLQLCAMGFGNITKEDFEERYPILGKRLTGDDKPRWIAIPCNDGMLHQMQGRDPKDKSRSAVLGSHWGILIIDTQRRDARWIDGHLKIGRKTKENKRRYYIQHMFKAGEAAGRVLRGYDQLMGHEPGKFLTGTLKHVPNDFEHNAFKGDKDSSCGPYVFAMLRYLFDNSTHLEDLKAAFSAAEKENHARKLGFDSREVRRAMQTVLEERENQGRTKDQLPCKVTIEILNALGKPDGRDLYSWVSRKWRNATDNALGNKRRDPRKVGGNGDNNNDDNDSSDDGDDDTSMYGRTGVPKKRLRDIIQNYPEKFKHLSTTETKLNQAYVIFLEQEAFVQNHQDNAANKNPTGGATSLNYIEAIQNHDVNFARLPTNKLQDFVKMKLIGEILTDKTPEWEQRAILTKVFGNFKQLSKDDTANWKAYDPRFKGRQNKSHNQVIEDLQQSVRTVPEGTLRGNIMNYPSSYLASLASQVVGQGASNPQMDSQITNQTTAPKPTKETAKKGQEGDKENNDSEEKPPISRNPDNPKKRKPDQSPRKTSPKKFKFDNPESSGSDLTVVEEIPEYDENMNPNWSRRLSLPHNEHP